MAYIKSHYQEILKGKNGGNPYAIQIFQSLFNGASQEDIDKMVANYISGNYNAGIAMPAPKVVHQTKPTPVVQPKKEEYRPKPKSVSDVSSLKDMKGHVYHGDPDEFAEGYYTSDNGSFDMSEYDAWYNAGLPQSRDDEEE